MKKQKLIIKLMFSLVKIRGTGVKILMFLSLLLLAPLARVQALDYTPAAAATPTSAVYSTGSLVNDGGTIYFIYNNTKIPFTNWQAFVGLGYSIKNVVNGDTSTYMLSQKYVISSAQQDHPWGSWLLYQGTVYYYDQDGLIPAPSQEIFTGNGGNWGMVVPANQYDLSALTVHPDVLPLTDNDARLNSPILPSSDSGTGVVDPNLPAGLTDNPNPATLNASLPQVDTGGQPFGFLDDQATTTPAAATTTATSATGTPPVAPSSVNVTNPSIPSEPSITLPPTAAAGLPVTVTVSSANSDGSALSYVFNWGDGSAPVTSSSSTATHTYATAGNYTVLVTVVNSAGMINSQSINISVGAPQ